MSAAPELAPQRRALIVAALVVGLLALLRGGDGDDSSAPNQPPSTLLTGDGGTRALFELTRELGLDSRAWMLPTREALFRERVQALAILGVGPALTRGEADVLLDWVRAGGRLFYAPLARPRGTGDREPFLEALGVRRLPGSSKAGWTAEQPPQAARSEEARLLLEGTPDSVTCDAGALDYSGLESTTPHEVLLGPDDTRAALALVHPGDGTLVLVASTAGLVNSELAESGLTVATLRALSALADGGTLWFDEFHHGHDERVGVVAAGTRYLLDTHTGWALLALLAVALLAVVCRGIRLGPPVPEPPRPGRSSLEHVDALAAAWGSARAHARPAVLLVEGLRLHLGVVQHKDLGERLTAAAGRDPGLRAAIATIREAAEGRGPTAAGPHGLVPLAAAIDVVLEAEGHHALPSGWESRA
jgi:hypothetical protein